MEKLQDTFKRYEASAQEWERQIEKLAKKYEEDRQNLYLLNAQIKMWIDILKAQIKKM